MIVGWRSLRTLHFGISSRCQQYLGICTLCRITSLQEYKLDLGIYCSRSQTTPISDLLQAPRPGVYGTKSQSTFINPIMDLPYEEYNLASRVSPLQRHGGQGNRYHTVRPIWWCRGQERGPRGSRFICFCGWLHCSASEHEVSLSGLFFHLDGRIPGKDGDARTSLARIGVAGFQIPSASWLLEKCAFYGRIGARYWYGYTWWIPGVQQ